jgi:hypothetical protein
VDHRTTWARKFKDTRRALFADRGGEDQCSEAVKLLIRRCAALEAELCFSEVKMAESTGDRGMNPSSMLGTSQKSEESTPRREIVVVQRPRPVIDVPPEDDDK